MSDAAARPAREGFRSRRPDPPPAGSGPAGPPRAAIVVEALLGPLDRLFSRAFGSRWNPLHQTGNLAILFLLSTIATGLYLFLFYSIDSPHASVERIRDGVFLGGLVRSVHRYSADLALVAAAVHLLRKLVQGHTWGPRTLAWTSGLVLLGVLLACGWTGLILVWDAQALGLAREGARLADLLPIFSTPIARAFSGAAPVPSSFFFMNLFLHVALPLGLAALLAVHVAKIARPALLPPRRIVWIALATVVAAAAAIPVPHAPAADLLALPGAAPLDLFFAFWLPFARRAGPVGHLIFWVAIATPAFLAPRLWRPRGRAINTSWVDERSCTGCTSCVDDCPYEAIRMAPRADFTTQRSELVARVDATRCVGCGICAASCAPMGIGPFGRTGRDQLLALEPRLDQAFAAGRRILVFGCANSGWDRRPELRTAGVEVVPLSCAGSLHTSAIEAALRRGAGGVLVLACAPRDCRFREGAKWTEQRLFAGREAELRERVDRTRVAFAALSTAESGRAVALVEELARRAAADADTGADPLAELDALCDAAALEAEEIHA
jgi:coenzyme F420-reducing hydrogenase delta subunit/Pyruvate/2-oxoacid:ferredoxin oxidoreductase delta subunit